MCNGDNIFFVVNVDQAKHGLFAINEKCFACLVADFEGLPKPFFASRNEFCGGKPHEKQIVHSVNGEVEFVGFSCFSH